MTFRSTVAAVTASGLIVVLSGSAPALAQETATPRGESSEARREGPRGPGRAPAQDELASELRRLRAELDEMRAIVEDERAARRVAEERLDRLRSGEPRDRDLPRDREPRERIERREEPGDVWVARAQLEAARAVLEAAELRAEGARRGLAKFDRTAERGGPSEAERFEARIVVAEAEARAAEARARLVEAEVRLDRAERSAGEAEADVVVEVESEFKVDDALEAAERVIEMLRSFRFDAGPR